MKERELITRTGLGEAPTEETICISDLQESILKISQDVTVLEDKQNVQAVKRAVNNTIKLQKVIVQMFKKRLQRIRKEMEKNKITKRKAHNYSAIKKSRRNK